MTVPNELINPSPLSSLKNGLKPNDIIHRYCSLPELDSLLGGNLTLTSPLRWTEGDPFEHPLFRASLIGIDGKPHDITRWGKQFHCQSWTLNEESDVMWRLYGEDASGVRISARAEGLLFQAYNSHSLFEHGEYLKVQLGIVRYLPELELKEILMNEFKSLIAPENADNGVLESLFLKREAYQLENEVRLVANDGSNLGNRKTGRVTAPLIDLHWISEIKFGPRMDQERFENYRNQLVQLDFDASKVRQSNLYGPLSYVIDLSKK
jgi:hypothetical protein